jgi:hypothetical protein
MQRTGRGMRLEGEDSFLSLELKGKI